MSRWGVAQSVALAAVVAGVAACGPAPAVEAPSSSEAATSTTRTPRITDDSGRPPVTFDPCHDLPDDVMSEAGYDAARKELSDMPMGWYTFLGCTYRKRDPVPGVRRGYHLNILAGNVTIDEELEKNARFATETTVHGRRALLELDPDTRDTCTYVLETSFGVVIFSRIYNKDHPGLVPQSEWCMGMDDLVTSVEPFLAD